MGAEYKRMYRMEEYKGKTIASYNKNAVRFSEKFKKLTDLQRRSEFHRFIDLLTGKNILDLGCGSGDAAYYFSQKGLDVTCVDLSENMIKLCLEKGLNAIVMDIEDLKFDESAFDGIWAVTSLLHIPKLKLPHVIDKLHSILKPHGILYVSVKEGEGEGVFKDKESDSERFFSFWEKEKLLDLFKNKFKLIESKEVKLGNTIFLEFFFKKN